MRTEYPHIPAAVDYVSTDVYASINGDWHNAPWQYPKYLYPKMLPHQRAFVIPPSFNVSFADCHGPGECADNGPTPPRGECTGRTPARKCTNARGLKCPAITDIAKLDACILNQTIGYLRWIEADEMIVGLDAFHLNEGSVFDVGLADMPRSIECYATLGAQLVAYRGQ
jgi:hypothetical protein